MCFINYTNPVTVIPLHYLLFKHQVMVHSQNQVLGISASVGMLMCIWSDFKMRLSKSLYLEKVLREHPCNWDRGFPIIVGFALLPSLSNYEGSLGNCLLLWCEKKKSD